jgi:hypothetical protein
MAAQIIRCPAHMLADIPTHEYRKAPCDPGISIEAQGRALCVVSLDRRLAWDHWPPFGHRTFALMLIGDPDTDSQDEPRPLPGDLVIPLIDALAAHATPHLCGHDAVEFGAILEAAKHAPGSLPLPRAHRLPRTRFERKLCESALLLERHWSKVLDDLDRELAVYGDALRRCGLGPIVAVLSTEGAVADLLRLMPDGAPNRYRTLTDHPVSGDALAEEIRWSRAMRHAMWWTLMELRSCGTYHHGEVAPDTFEELDRFGCVFPVPDWGQRLWRRHELTESEYPPLVPARGVPSAMQQLAAACDRRLLGHRHPVIRAALVAYMFIRARPFGDSDRKAMELAFNLLLRQMDLPPMPVMLMFHRRRLDMAAALRDAQMQGRPHRFVEASLHLVTEALAAGKAMLDPLKIEYERLTGALVDAAFDHASAEDAVTALLSNMLTPQGLDALDRLATEPDIEREADHLHKLGLVDLVEAGGTHWWSSPVARKLLTTIT